MKRWTLSLGVGIVLTSCSGDPPATAAPSAAPTPSEPPVVALTQTPDPAALPPSGAEREFTTDFTIHSVPYSDVLSGGPPKDGIPALLDPSVVSIGEADQWLMPQEGVVVIEAGGAARAYPLQILMWHEIANDFVGGIPVVVTYCPLCNTAVAFEREFEGRVLDFGTTGRLRFSNLIMYDRQTETWWQQASGDAIAGELTGSRLTFHPAVILAWADFKQAFPQGTVVGRDTGHVRPYGSNPYAGYDAVRNTPFLYRGPETPKRAAQMERVLVVEQGGESASYPYGVLAEVGVVNDLVGGAPIAVFWKPGVASALDAGSVAAGRDVGSAAAFSRTLEGDILTFSVEDGRILDDSTGSEWDLLGRAQSGPLEGLRLEPLISINHFWFSAVAFDPETRLFEP